MQITTIIGLLLAIIGILGGMYFKGVPFSALANPAAIFMIIVGTVGAVLNAFPAGDAKNIPNLFKIVFAGKKLNYTNAEIINLITELAQLARKEGMLSLETKLKDIKDPFLARGITLMTMGVTNEVIQDTLIEEVEAMEQRHAANAGVFTQAGTYAPTLGVLGAVIGLIAALGNMADQEKLGHAISGAFMATVYGIFTGYVLWHPFANKLKRISKAEVLNKRIIIEGVLLMHEGMAPNMIKEKMMSFLSINERDKYFPDTKK